jgi:hypothetical protein
LLALAERAVAEFVDFTRDRRSRGLARGRSGGHAIDGGRSGGTGETAALIGEHTLDRNISMVESRQKIDAEQSLVAAECVLFDAACTFRRQVDPSKAGRRHGRCMRPIRSRKSSATHRRHRRI